MTLTSGLPCVRRVEDELAADRRHADAVAVAADAPHDALDEVPRPRIGRVAEPQRVEHGDRPGAHREDVAEDPADAGRGALVRLDGARVVVRLDLERDGEPVADRDDAGVLARPGDDALAAPVGSVRSSGRELLYEQCSLHITLNIASSRSFGSRPPSRSRIASSSSSVTPSRRWSGSLGGRRGRLGHASSGAGRRPPGRAGPLALRGRALDERADDPQPVVASRASPRPRSPGGASGPPRCRRRSITPAIARSEPFGLAGRPRRRPASRPAGRSGTGPGRRASSASSVASSA